MNILRAKRVPGNSGVATFKMTHIGFVISYIYIQYSAIHNITRKVIRQYVSAYLSSYCQALILVVNIH
jgi:hypothetical protein